MPLPIDKTLQTLLAGLTLVVLTATGWAQSRPTPTPPDSKPPIINVIYPRDSQEVASVDSTFILGSVTPGSRLVINGVQVSVYETGGFLAFLPVTPGDFAFHLHAENERGRDTAIVNLRVADLRPIPPDSGVRIRSESVGPLWTRTVRPNDEISVQFSGTVSCRASFRIISPGDTTPWHRMVELKNAAPTVWNPGESDPFLMVPDSMPVYPSAREGPGTYHGIWRTPSGLTWDTLRIEVRLRSPSDSAEASTAMAPGRLVPVEFWPPRVVELTDSVQILRMGPRLGYFTIMQPAGVRVRWWGRAGPWTILEPAPGYEAWIETEKTRLLAEGMPLPGSLISRMKTVASKSSVMLQIGTSERLPFKVTVSDDLRRLRILIFGATANTDWIEQDPADDMIQEVSWEQTRPQVYEVTVNLHKPVWGYDARYEGGQLVVEFRRPPQLRRELEGFKVAVDAGHSVDPGAIGPTGLMEKDANLKIAWEVKRFLERKGAQVIMTRWASEDVPLYDRPAIANSQGADLFVSVHNNAVPDGINPYARNGTGTYFYHPFSRDLARQVHRWTRDATGLDDYGLTGGNFAVIRPTQYPSVLIECAFIIIPEQEALLYTPEFITRIGQGIANGVAEFVRERLGR